MEAQLKSICSELFREEVVIELSRPDEKFGDFATNVALKLAGKINKTPREVAEQIAGKLRSYGEFSEVSVAEPGFINIRLKDTVIFESAINAVNLDKPLDSKVVVTEYSDPNPFKVLHVGHLYTSVVGDAISNIFEAAGAKVHRVNYGGDVGLHVAKTMWVMLKDLGGENPDKLDAIKADERSNWLADCYVKGTAAYDDDSSAQLEIVELNKKIYKISTTDDKDSPLAKIYWTTRQWSYDYFDEFYARIGVSFEKYYPESTVAELGLTTVKNQTPKIYSQSDGAIVYKGEQDGLHTRVFVTKEGLPTYEAKEVGLLLQKNHDYKFNKSVIITANEQAQYMQVVLASAAKFEPDLVNKTKHLTHGMVKLPGAEKMSSRKGNFIKAVDILAAAENSSNEINDRTTPEIVLGAVKYSFLKSSLGGDLIYDAKESVSLEGNSGPYLQYAYTRARSILTKGGEVQSVEIDTLNSSERSLARKITHYGEIFNLALAETSPHHICTYLYELSQVFNRFYENNRVIGDERAAIRLQLVRAYSEVLASGLQLLGIPIPEKM